jgi:hypothetical protein
MSSDAVPSAERQTWPAELSSLELTMVFESSELNSEEFRSWMVASGAEHRVTPRLLTFPITAQHTGLNVWGVVRAWADSDKDFIVVWSLRPISAQTVIPAKSASFQAVLEQLASMARIDDPTTEPLGARGAFALFKRDWVPTIALPMRLPGVLDSTAGSPEISGFEFSFSQPDSPVKHAKISTHEGVDEFHVELTVVSSLAPLATLVTRACDAVSAQLPLLALRRTGPSELTP